jgi:hypothetical protein
MDDELTEAQMKELREANIYHISGDDIAFPNFKYCTWDAPYYMEMNNGNWVRIPKEEME